MHPEPKWTYIVLNSKFEVKTSGSVFSSTAEPDWVFSDILNKTSRGLQEGDVIVLCSPRQDMMMRKVKVGAISLVRV